MKQQRAEYLVTTTINDRIKVVGRFAPDPKRGNIGEQAKAKLREFRKKYPKARIWSLGEHLEDTP